MRLTLKEATKMNRIDNVRLVQAALLAAIVTVCVVPNAALGEAMPRPVPDAFERFVAAHPYGSDIIDADQAPDVFERYVKSHASPSTVVVDGRSPDTRDAAQSARFEVMNDRSPDTGEAGATIQRVGSVTSGGFNWRDAGIGAATGGGLILLMGASTLLLLRTHRRHHVQAM
jgi:hypothetical protein